MQIEEWLAVEELRKVQQRSMNLEEFYSKVSKLVEDGKFSNAQAKVREFIQGCNLLWLEWGHP